MCFYKKWKAEFANWGKRKLPMTPCVHLEYLIVKKEIKQNRRATSGRGADKDSQTGERGGNDMREGRYNNPTHLPPPRHYPNYLPLPHPISAPPPKKIRFPKKKGQCDKKIPCLDVCELSGKHRRWLGRIGMAQGWTAEEGPRGMVSCLPLGELDGKEEGGVKVNPPQMKSPLPYNVPPGGETILAVK